MKNIKTKIIILMLTCIIAISSVWAGKTYAYYNAIQSAQGIVSLGNLQINNFAETNVETELKVVPNQTYSKTFSANIKSSIKYYKRLSLTVTTDISNEKKHKSGCGDIVEDTLDIFQVEVMGFTPYADDGVTYYYVLIPTTPDDENSVLEEFTMSFTLHDWVGDGGCDYYMGANINIIVKLEVIQADYLEDYGLADKDTFTISTLHEIWGSAVGANSRYYTRIDENGDESATGDYILFGYYPKTVATSAEVASINSTNRMDADGYYLDADGNRYVKKSANPYGSGYKFSNGTSISKGTNYYFKLEQIKWRILTTKNGKAMLLAEDIIDAHAFYYYSSSSNRTINSKTIYANNYKYSEIRAWLNGYSYIGQSGTISTYLNNGFLQTAFTSQEQSIVQTTTIDNSLASTLDSSNSYVCEDTDDKVFILSKKELSTTDYGFKSSILASDSAREKITTDYARANYALTMLSDSDKVNNGWWWTRSPLYNKNASDINVHINGALYYSSGRPVSGTSEHKDGGVVPALWIKL